jgi:hypothetical protein
MKRVLAAVFLAGFAVLAGADPGRPGVSVSRAWLVQVEDSGRVESVPGPRPPGAAEALYTIRFRYDGETDAPGLVIVQPLPAGGRYIAGSAAGPGASVTFSVDGGETFGPADSLAVPDEAGEARPAIADDYTHIRWELPGRFPPGMGGIVSYRARFGGGAGEPAEGAEGG